VARHAAVVLAVVVVVVLQTHLSVISVEGARGGQVVGGGGAIPASLLVEWGLDSPAAGLDGYAGTGRRGIGGRWSGGLSGTFL